MKVLYIVHQFYPHYGSGTERITYNIASMIQKAGNRVKVITYRVDHKGPVTGECHNVKYNEFIYNKVPVLEFFLTKEPHDLNFGLSNADVLSFAKEILRRENPDIVHVCHPMRVCSFLDAAEQLGIPCVVTATDLMYICPKIIMTNMKGEICRDPDGGINCNASCFDTGDNNEERMERSKRLLTKASFVASPSEFIGYMIQKQIPELGIKTIRHGMDSSGIAKNAKIYSKGSIINFGFVGTVNRHKGVHLILDAFMKTSAKNIRLNIFGYFDKSYGQKLVNKASNDNRIRFFGGFEKDKIEDVYKEIDVLLIPSLCYESYSLVKHEAIMRNIPVIVSDIGALGDGIEHGVNGYKFSLEDSDSLNRILSSISCNPEKLNDIKRELTHFVIPTVEQESFQYLSLYKKCVNKLTERVRG
jgi:glycosyltransferase involved in cell wall biosynthesis